MYEGRTRGKRLKYTYSDDEDIFSDDAPTRRSGRNASNNAAPAEPRTRFTASGRQIRSRAGGLYGEALLSGQREDSEEEEETARPQRSRTSNNPNGYSGYADDDLDDESEAQSSGQESGKDWQSENDENDFEGDDEGDSASGDESVINGEAPSLVIQLKYGKGNALDAPKPPIAEPPPVQDTKTKDVSQVDGSTDPPGPVSEPKEPTKELELKAPADTPQQATNAPAVTGQSISSLLIYEESKSEQPAEANKVSEEGDKTEKRHDTGFPSGSHLSQILNPPS